MLDLIDEAVASGARRRKACEVLGVSARMIERWRKALRESVSSERISSERISSERISSERISSERISSERISALEDMRRGPHSEPRNKLSASERQRARELLTSKRFRDLSVNQIVPLLADEGRYIGSEATLYRILREEELNAHRGKAKESEKRPRASHVARGPNEVWSWDITYLRSPVRGVFFYLYMIMDVWSRKIVGWTVQATESSELASELFKRTCLRTGIDPRGIVLHADNGGPMKGSTMLATMERLGVLASFSRPRVSDDNPYSESLFRTMKYRPEYPSGPFADLEAARAWVTAFVEWYNTAHLHSGIRFVTPEARHSGSEKEILEQRRAVYERAREKNPERWAAGRTRNWSQVEEVRLNPPKSTEAATRAELYAA